MDKRIPPETIARYDADRDFSNKAIRSICYAPHVALYFDQRGDVRVCCQNSMFRVGNIVRDRLKNIWSGELINELRKSLEEYDLSRGCKFCEWQLADENSFTRFMRTYDDYQVDSPAPIWPRRMEFSVSNTCNLECVMCNGEWSSSIRTRREKLPPIPKVYPDVFFEDLVEFLPHLEIVRFLGGEPFLAQETLRIADLLVDSGSKALCHVTTNGTQFNERVERILNNLRVAIAVSMDGVTKETVERVRKNADFDSLVQNVKRFREYTKKQGTDFGLTFCLIKPNWHEFGDYLAFADDLDCDVAVNTVMSPPEQSLYCLPNKELADIVSQLQQKSHFYEAKLSRNKSVWLEELKRLSNYLSQHPEGEKLYFKQTKLSDFFESAPSSAFGEEALSQAIEADLYKFAQKKPVAFWVSAENVIEQIVGDGQAALGFDPSGLVGRSIREMEHELAKNYGMSASVFDVDQDGDRVEHRVKWSKNGKHFALLRAVTIPRRDDVGTIVGTKTWVALQIEPSGELIQISSAKDL